MLLRCVYPVLNTSKEDSSELLPNPDLLLSSNWSDLKASKPLLLKKNRFAKKNWLTWWLRGDDKVFEEVWPARTKVDLSIRRTRSTDIWFHLNRTNTLVEVQKDVECLSEGFDYISVCNLMWARILFGSEWWTNLSNLEAFQGGLDYYVTVTKWLSDQIKVKSVNIGKDWVNYIECASLAGYRNLPFPGFDYFEKAQEYATGGMDHPLPLGLTFENVARDVLTTTPDYVQYVSLEDFILHEEWATSGSSSVGKLFILDDEDKEIKIKARKNFVSDVVDRQELLDLTLLNMDKQVNKTLVKSELGKVRLAVAADIEGYLSMSWLSYLLNGAYKKWKGSTIEETVLQQNARMLNMLKLCKDHYGLPFDYAGFEHQPTTQELQIIVRILGEIAVLNVPVSERPKFWSYLDRIILSFDHDTLISKFGDTSKTFKVTGGLMSGMRLTSVIGNAWNTIMTECVFKLLEKSGVDTSNIVDYIRGDDSAIFFDSVPKAQLFELGYRRIGVLGGVGKFSIKRHQMEFLRVWYSKRCFGYPARALPGIVQRKPWSNAPWEEEMVLKSLKEVTVTLTRRGVDSEAVWKSLKTKWCILHRLPVASVMVPRSLGGFGIDTWDHKTFLTNKVPRIDKPPFTIMNQNDFRYHKVCALADELGLTLDENDLREIAIDQLSQVIASDDIPSVGKMFRTKWKQAIKLVKISSYTKPLAEYPKFISMALPPLDLNEDSLSRATLYLNDRCGTYGKYKTNVSKLQLVKPFLKYTKESLRKYIRRTDPYLANAIAKEKGHIGEVLDWLSGNVFSPTYKIHPSVSYLVPLYTACVLSQTRKWQNQSNIIASTISRAVEDCLLNSPLIANLWCW